MEGRENGVQRREQRVMAGLRTTTSSSSSTRNSSRLVGRVGGGEQRAFRGLSRPSWLSRTSFVRGEWSAMSSRLWSAIGPG